jgi:hypothetical protein
MLKGTLDDFTLPDIFRLMSLSKKTGLLQVERSAGQGKVYFRDGEVYYAESSLSKEPLGQKLVKAKVLTEGQLRKALDQHAGSGKRLGEVLLESGAVDEEQIMMVIRQQIEDAAFDLLRWELGEFLWDPAVEATPEVTIYVTVENLIMEASRRLDELEVIQRKIPSPETVLAMAATPPEGAVEINITPEEWRILVLVNGARSVREIGEMVGLDDFSAMRTLYGLVSAGLIEVQGHVEPAPQASPARTTPVAASRPEPTPQPEPASESTPEAQATPEPEAAPEPEPEPAPKPEPAPAPEPEPLPEPLQEGIRGDVQEPPAAELPQEPEQRQEPEPQLEPTRSAFETLMAEEPPAPFEEAPEVPAARGEVVVEEPLTGRVPTVDPLGQPEEPSEADLVAELHPVPDVPAVRDEPDLPLEAFDAPGPGELVAEGPGESRHEDPLIAEILAPQAPATPEPAPPAPQPLVQPPAPEVGAPDAGPETRVDRVAAVRELAGLFSENEEEEPAPQRPRSVAPDGPPDNRKRVEDDEQVTRGLISRLIDGVKGL